MNYSDANGQSIYHGRMFLYSREEERFYRYAEYEYRVYADPAPFYVYTESDEPRYLIETELAIEYEVLAGLFNPCVPFNEE